MKMIEKLQIVSKTLLVAGLFLGAELTFADARVRTGVPQSTLNVPSEKTVETPSSSSSIWAVGGVNTKMGQISGLPAYLFETTSFKPVLLSGVKIGLRSPMPFELLPESEWSTSLGIEWTRWTRTSRLNRGSNFQELTQGLSYFALDAQLLWHPEELRIDSFQGAVVAGIRPGVGMINRSAVSEFSSLYGMGAVVAPEFAWVPEQSMRLSLSVPVSVEKIVGANGITPTLAVQMEVGYRL
jgi:hypothetical protein